MTKILIVQARFYEEISDMLLQGAIAEIKDKNFEYEIINVLGAFEIPAAISMASKSNKYAGFIALGCVIRGETTHYDYVCIESARGLNDLAIKDNLAIGYGILTVENEEQAYARANPKDLNKGGFAAKAAIRMIELQKKFLKL
jgi:6,7-dimethyl-8-ribityllumazine synthase